MTVAEMIDRIIAAYPGASPEAMATFKPVFHARFGRREGPHLAQAFADTLSTFRPNARQPFPIPADIEQHMPSMPRGDESSVGPPIRGKLEGRQARSRELLADWESGQGAKIKRERAAELHAACWLEATDQCRAKALDERVTRIILDQPTINKCFQRAISTERVRRFGRSPADPQRHWSQLVEIATEWGLDITPEWWGKETSKSLTKQEAA